MQKSNFPLFLPLLLENLNIRLVLFSCLEDEFVLEFDLDEKFNLLQTEGINVDNIVFEPKIKTRTFQGFYPLVFQISSSN